MCQILDECRWLYNRLLEERKLAWEETDTSVRLYDQINRLVALQAERPALASVQPGVAERRRAARPGLQGVLPPRQGGRDAGFPPVQGPWSL